MEQYLFNLAQPGEDTGELQAVVTPNIWLLSSEEIPPILFTTEEVGRLLEIGKCRVYDLIRQRELRSVKVGASRRISARALKEYVEHARGVSRRDEAAAGANGEGTVYQRDGRSLGGAGVRQPSPTGAGSAAASTAQTRKEVETKMTELRQQSDTGRVIAPAAPDPRRLPRGVADADRGGAGAPEHAGRPIATTPSGT